MLYEFEQEGLLLKLPRRLKRHQIKQAIWKRIIWKLLVAPSDGDPRKFWH